jgi:hypothetical protein
MEQQKADTPICILALSCLSTPIQPIIEHISNVCWRWYIICEEEHAPNNMDMREKQHFVHP